MEDMEEDTLTTDIHPYVSFVNDCLCAYGMGTEEVEATVEDMEEDSLATDIPPHILFVNDCLCAVPRGRVRRMRRPWWRIWRRIH